MKTEHNNFKNYFQQITLHSYIQYSGLVVLNPVSITLLHRFTSRAPPNAVPQLIPLYSPSSTDLDLLYATHSESR